MECWTDEKVASIGSFFFFGNAVGVFTLFLPGKFGSMKTFKFFAFPCIALGFQMVVFPTNYFNLCLGYFLIGLCNFKYMIILSYYSEISLKIHDVIATSITTAADGSGTLFMCFWLIYFSGINKNAINFYIFVHFVSVFTGLMMIFFLVESPYWLIK